MNIHMHTQHVGTRWGVCFLHAYAECEAEDSLWVQNCQFRHYIYVYYVQWHPS